LAVRGIGLDDVANAIGNNTVELSVGSLQGPQQAYQVGANIQLRVLRVLSVMTPGP